METQLEPQELQRAALFNLVLQVTDHTRLDELRQMTQRVRKKFPCRIITLAESRATSVSTETTGTEILCDQVEIGFAPDERERLPYLVLPQLLPDLPLHLFWAGAPNLEDSLFRCLQPHITRLICEPTDISEVPHFARFLAEERFHGELSDLRWAHLDGWRLLLASLFTAIADTRRLAIRYQALPEGGVSIYALYLRAWLATRLGWGAIDVSLEPEDEADQPEGTILAMELLSHDDEQTRLTLGDDCVHVSSDSPQKCGIPYAVYLPRASKGETLINELFRKGTSEHYRAMVSQLEQL